MGALLNIVIMLCVSSLLLISLVGGAGAGLYAAGSKEQTDKLEREANEVWIKQMEDDMIEELDQFEDPRSKSFRTKFEKSKGMGQLPYYPSSAYFRRRPIESALLWPERTDTLPDRGRDSFSLEGDPVQVVDNISDVEVDWDRYNENAWTSLWDKDDLRVDCGDDAINGFQIRSEKFSRPREFVKEKKNETGITKLFKHQFRSYHDNYKQVYKCLTGAPGWKWDENERKQIGGDFVTPISDQKTDVLKAKKSKTNDSKILDCDFKTLGSKVYGEDAAGKNFPLAMIKPDWSKSLAKTEWQQKGGIRNIWVRDHRPDPKKVGFDYKCLKKPVAGPCKPVKFTEWTPFLASQGKGIRELRHKMMNGSYKKTSPEEIGVHQTLKEKLPYGGKGEIDPIMGLGKVKCHPTEVLTRVDFEISEGLAAPKDWIRFAYTCCKM